MTQTLFEFIREQSYVKNKSLNQLSRDIDVSYPTINNLKHRAPSRMTYHKLAQYFDVEVYDLLQYPIKK